MKYNSTRDKSIQVNAAEAILSGLAGDGGLFVPETIPAFEKDISALTEMDYRETAFEVMRLYFTDFSKEELQGCIDAAYDDKFDIPEIAPLSYVDHAYYLELFHGPTIAFKDMALSILPHLLTTAAKKLQIKEEIVILTATSGDTGKAALAGFADVPGTRIMVFYPKDGVSPIQKLQMVTQKGANTSVVGVEGNFDDCQTGVKKIFHDEELREKLRSEGFRFSSANSINIGRLVPQIVYYFYAYGMLMKQERIQPGEKMDVCVPTGNFGNILAAFYAKNMGLPIRKLICASNENKVLFDFFQTGEYNRNREFILTSSPSMDILISSNLERLIYYISGNDPAKTAGLMQELAAKGSYEIDDKMKERLSGFFGSYASEEETAEEIRRVYEDTGYVLDPHTAVASAAVRKIRKEEDVPLLIASTASPFKFARSVMDAIGKDLPDVPDMELIDALSEAGNLPVPKAVEELRNAPVLHRKNAEIDKMKETVEDFLK